MRGSLTRSLSYIAVFFPQETKANEHCTDTVTAKHDSSLSTQIANSAYADDAAMKNHGCCMPHVPLWCIQSGSNKDRPNERATRVSDRTETGRDEIDPLQLCERP